MPEHEEILGALRAGGSPAEDLLLFRDGTLHLSRSHSPPTVDLITYSSMNPMFNLEEITNSATHHNEADPDERFGIDFVHPTAPRKSTFQCSSETNSSTGPFYSTRKLKQRPLWDLK